MTGISDAFYRIYIETRVTASGLPASTAKAGFRLTSLLIQNHIKGGQHDLDKWPLKSSRVVLEFKWIFVPILKGFL